MNNLAMVLPKIPQDKRVIPNDIVRSSLFTVSNHNTARQYINDKEIYTYGSTDITYTGEELRQDDEDVWMQLIYNIKQGDNYYTEFAPYSMLKNIGWAQRTQYREKLKKCLNRLSATSLTIHNKSLKQGLTVSLVRKFQWKNDGKGENFKKWKIWIEPEISMLFANSQYSKVLWEQRQKLTPLAKWLHAFYSSHADPYGIKIQTIHKICGSKMKNLKHFKPILKESLHEMMKVGFLVDFEITNSNIVCVERAKLKYSITQV